MGGETWCWGSNNVLTSFEAGPRRASVLDGAQSVALASDALSFVTRSGEVDWLGDTRVWRGGYLVAGETLQRPRAVSGIANAREVAVGHAGWACARLVDGRVSCWGGANCFANAADEPLTAFLVPAVDDAVALSMSLDVACAVARSGAVWCWGDGFHAAGEREGNRHCVPARLGGGDGATDVSVSVSGICIARARQPVSCWASFWGQPRSAGVGPRFAPDSPDAPIVLRGSSGVIKVWNRDQYVAGLTGNGVLFGWGNLPGSGGGAVEMQTASPVVLGREVVGFDGDQHGYCVLQRAGGVLCAGSNIGGELGTTPPRGGGLVRVPF